MNCVVRESMTGLRTFRLPETVTGSDDDAELGRRLITAWQADGILQIATDAAQDRTTAAAMAASRRFFHGLTIEEKSRFVSDLTYSGYIASGEEVTDGIADYSEIFTICKTFRSTTPASSANGRATDRFRGRTSATATPCGSS